jgi:3-oxoacyl-[acyl-carrier protein] reductase
MDLKLQGKKAFVTGGSSGIGEAIVKMLAQEGAEVVVHGRNQKELERVHSEITDAGGKAIIVAGDIAIDEEAKKVAEEVLTKLGSIDILVNNAGAYHHISDWLHTAPSEWLDLYNTNVVSMVRMVHWLVPQMVAKKWGRIIQIASVAGTHPHAGSPDYSATKAANINMTVSLARELAQTGITVNTVSPGPILTKGVQGLLYDIAKERKWGSEWANIEKYASSELFPTLVGRLGRPHEVAALVVFLSSPLADFITGADFRVDGGRAGSIN